MPIVRGCNFPDDLFYDVPRHLWYRPQDDGTWRIGMTEVAVGMAGGDILACMPKSAGRRIEAGKACATVESGKWVGAARIAFDAEIVASNEAAMDMPRTIGRDPYGAGWMVVVRPDDPQAPGRVLLPAAEIVHPYERQMIADRFGGCDRVTQR